MKRPTDVFWNELAKLDESMAQLSYYELLGVEPAASTDALCKSYERQIRVLHPDRHARESDPDRQKTLTRVYARVAEAYRVLSNPQQRAGYDKGLGKGQTRFVESRTDHGQSAAAVDPKHPQARSLLEQAQVLLAKGDTKGAKAKLSLAKQYEPDSTAIAGALASCEPAAPTAPTLVEQASEVDHPAEEPRALAQVNAVQAAEAAREFAESPPSRVHARAPMGQNIKVSCATWTDVQTFYMHNISRGGMLLRCKTLLPIGTILELSLLTPDREAIDMPAQVVRHVQPHQAGQRPGIGIKFLLIPEPTRERFELLLKVAGLPPLAEEVTTKASARESSADSAIASARRLIEEGSYSKACLELQSPVRDNPDDKCMRSLFHLAAGLMARERSQDAAAHTHFERALRFDPDSPIILRMLRENGA